MAEPPPPTRVDPPVQIAAADPDDMPSTTVPAAEPPSGEERVHVSPAPRRRSIGRTTTGESFTGQRISLDFKDADIQNVLRVLADVSGLNIIARTTQGRSR